MALRRFNAWWRVAYGDAPLTAKLPDGSELLRARDRRYVARALVLASDWGLHTLVSGRYPYVLLVLDIGNTRLKWAEFTMDQIGARGAIFLAEVEHFVERAGFAARVPERGRQPCGQSGVERAG